MMKERQRQEGGGDQEEETEEAPRSPADHEPKIMGISIKSTPMYLKLIYLIAILAFFGGLVAFGLHKLTPKEALKKKVKKSK